MTSQALLQDENLAEKGDITSDFRYNNNVASSHLYIRMGFLRKVYGLLSVQLVMTTIVAGTCAYTPQIRTTLHANPWIFILCLPFSIGLLIALHVKRHQVPINFFLLGAFTIVEAITVGVVVGLYEVESVVKALCLTAAITVVLTLYTMQSKRDFSIMGTGLLMCLTAVFGLGIMNIFMFSKGMDLIIAGVSAILFSFFIVYDTHIFVLLTEATSLLCQHTWHYPFFFRPYEVRHCIGRKTFPLHYLLPFLYITVEMHTRCNFFSTLLEVFFQTALFSSNQTYKIMMTKLSAEEYILATINLYLDIINLFLELLRIFGERRN